MQHIILTDKNIISDARKCRRGSVWWIILLSLQESIFFKQGRQIQGWTIYISTQFLFFCFFLQLGLLKTTYSENIWGSFNPLPVKEMAQKMTQMDRDGEQWPPNHLFVSHAKEQKLVAHFLMLLEAHYTLSFRSQ